MSKKKIEYADVAHFITTCTYAEADQLETLIMERKEEILDEDSDDSDLDDDDDEDWEDDTEDSDLE